MKLTRFLIADNPMVEGSPSAIIHTVEPKAIIEILEGHVECASPYGHYVYHEERYTLRVHHLMTQEFDSEKHHLIINKLLDRAWHWYKAYMQWQDEQEI